MDIGREAVESERFLCCCENVGDGESLANSFNLAAEACDAAVSIVNFLVRSAGNVGERGESSNDEFR